MKQSSDSLPPPPEINTSPENQWLKDNGPYLVQQSPCNWVIESGSPSLLFGAAKDFIFPQVAKDFIFPQVLGGQNHKRQ